MLISLCLKNIYVANIQLGGMQLEAVLEVLCPDILNSIYTIYIVLKIFGYLNSHSESFYEVGGFGLPHLVDKYYWFVFLLLY